MLSYLACAACGRPLTAGCRLGLLEEFREDCVDMEAPVDRGVMVVLPEK